MTGAGITLLAAALTFSAPSGPTVEIDTGPVAVMRKVALAEGEGGWRMSGFVCRPLGRVGPWPAAAVVETLDRQGQVLARSWTPVPRLTGAHGRIGCRPLTLRLGSAQASDARFRIRFD